MKTRYIMKPSSVHVRGIHENLKAVVGVVTLPCMYKCIMHNLVFEVLKSQREINLLSRWVCIKLGFVVMNVNQAGINKSCKSVVNKCADVISDHIGCLIGKYEIKMDDNVTPVINPPPPPPQVYPISLLGQGQGRVKMSWGSLCNSKGNKTDCMGKHHGGGQQEGE